MFEKNKYSRYVPVNISKRKELQDSECSKLVAYIGDNNILNQVA